MIDRAIESFEFVDLLGVELLGQFVQCGHGSIGVLLSEIEYLQGFSLCEKLRERFGRLHHIQSEGATGLVLEASFEELQGGHAF